MSHLYLGTEHMLLRPSGNTPAGMLPVFFYLIVAPDRHYQCRRFILSWFLASNADNILGKAFLSVSGKSYLNLNNNTAYLRVMEEGAET